MHQVRRTESPALWWVRRDLRLHDNPALTAALQHSKVVPVFVLEPALQSAAPRRAAFLQANLNALHWALRERGCSLVVRKGEPARVLAEVCAEVGAVAVYAQADVSPFARLREQQVSRTAVPLQLVAWSTLHPPGTVTHSHGKPYTIYGAFRRAALALPAPPTLPTPRRLSPHGVSGEPLPGASLPAGEPVALHRLETFRREHLFRYHRDRNRLDGNATSGLSAYLRFGVLSPRLAYWMAAQAAAALDGDTRRGAEAWRDELLWREFFAHLLYHFPHTRERPLRAEYGSLRWDNDEKLFRAWCEGRTGYPLVDAAMRELAQTGWIHNRARMVAASFLVKNLLVDWRWGERYFLQQLLDGDPASNSGNWQWVAGVGVDAAPYFRVFNPVLQGRRFDPQGAYVRRWIPELARVPSPYVHAPWTLPRDDQIMYGCRVGRDYPAPVVDLSTSRRRALDRYAAVHGRR